MTTSMSSSHSDNGDDKRIDGQIDGRPAPEPKIEPTPKSDGPELSAQSEPARPRPNKDFVRSHTAHFIAFGGGAGLSPVAPGTVGTLVAFPLFWILALFLIKPPPIRYYDRTLRGGFGVMFDDLLAAFLTLLCLAAWKAFVI